MPFMVIKFGGSIEAVEGGARAFGEVHIDGAEETDGDKLKEAVVLALTIAWSGGDYTAASVSADPAALIAGLENQLMFGMLPGCTAKVTALTVMGGAEPIEPTEGITLGGDVDMPDGRKAKLV